MSGVIDVGVVGAGPAGLAAALAAGELGCEVTLIDAGSGPGGPVYRPGTLFPGRDRRAAAGPLPPRLARFRQAVRGRHLAATWVSHAVRDDDGLVTLGVGGLEGGAETTVVVRAAVLATGAADVALPFPGWDLPGVTTAGAAWALLTEQGVTVGRRVVVGGSGPLLLPVAARLADAGVQVAAVVEAAGELATFPGGRTAADGPAVALARRGVPVRTGHAVIACHGTGRVEQAVIARLDRGGRPVPGTRSTEPVDAVHVSSGLAAELELARTLGCAEVPHAWPPAATVACGASLATSVPGVFAAGAVTGTSGAAAAELAGELAGVSAASYLARLDPAAAAERVRDLRARLGRVHPPAAPLRPPGPGWLDGLDGSTVVCRCAETPWSSVAAALAGGARDLPALQAATGGGLGACQARGCGPVLRYAVSAAGRMRV